MHHQCGLLTMALGMHQGVPAAHELPVDVRGATAVCNAPHNTRGRWGEGAEVDFAANDQSPPE